MARNDVTRIVRTENTILTREEMIGILGNLLDEHEPDVVMSEKVRQGIYTVYENLCNMTYSKRKEE